MQTFIQFITSSVVPSPFLLVFFDKTVFVAHFCFTCSCYQYTKHFQCRQIVNCVLEAFITVLFLYYINFNFFFANLILWQSNIMTENMPFVLYHTHRCFFLLVCFTYNPLIASGQFIGAHGTDVSSRLRLLSGKTSLQEKKSTSHRWDSNPVPCRQHSHCSKRAKPLRHLALFEW